MLFCHKIVFAIYALLCGENLAKNSVCGEKMTNIRYAKKQYVIHLPACFSQLTLAETNEDLKFNFDIEKTTNLDN